MKQQNETAAVELLGKMGVTTEKHAPQIPCGYKEQIADGKTLACGSVYRGEVFYCRDCMKSMLSNAHTIANAIAEMTLVAVTDFDIEGKVAESTINGMREFLVNIGAIQE